MGRIARGLALAQGLYWGVTGVWPILHPRSFEAVIGPRRERWVAKSMGAVVAVVGGTLLVAGARLLSAGFQRSELAAVWLFAGEPPAAGLWSRPGAISLAGAAGALPVALFEPEPIARASRVDELADYAVYLGPGTRIEGR